MGTLLGGFNSVLDNVPFNCAVAWCDWIRSQLVDFM